MDNPLIALLQQFKPIGIDDIAIIEKAFVRKDFKENGQLFSPGGICRELFFICCGVLRIQVLNEKGNSVTHYFLKENQFCTILNSFTNQVPAEESIEAACNAEVLAINHDSLLKLYEQVPYLKTLIDNVIQQGLIDKINTRNAYLGHGSLERYRLFIARQPEVASRVSMGDIASYLGITPQSLSRIRKNIK